MNLHLAAGPVIFLDANVLISAAWKEGSEIAQLWDFEGPKLVTSNYVMAEVERNLPRVDQIERLRRLLLKVRVHFFKAQPDAAEAVLLPAKDRHVLAAAIQMRCQLLLSGDKRHFGPLCGSVIQGVQILAPPVLLQALRQRSS